MQDRYVADVGDFGKYGLLRALCAGASGHGRLTLAINWYLVPDESHNNDGGHVAYLSSDRSYGESLARCDRPLHDALHQLVHTNARNVKAVAERGILPAATKFYDAPLSYVGIAPRERRARRAAWIEAGLTATADADVAFLDPDNGLQVGVSEFSRKGPKYVFWGDLRPYMDRGQTVIVYHHIGRRGSADEQVLQRFQQLRPFLPQGYEVFAIRYRRGTSRAYFVLGDPRHRMDCRARAFMNTHWSTHFVLHHP